MKLCIVIPAYNEEKRIGRTLEDYCEFFKEKKKQKELDFEILVVINNTTDRTEDVVKFYKKKCKELSYLNFKQGGKGFAVRKGFEYALAGDFDLIGFTDADDSTDAENFYKLVKAMDKYDGVIGSRYVKGAIVKPKQPFSRIIASRVFNLIVRGLFLMPFRDTQNGGKVFKKEVIKSIMKELSITQWAFDIDLLHQINKKRYIIKEFPILWKDKEGSKVNLFRASIQMFFAVMQLRMLNSPIKDFSKILKPAVAVLYKLIR